MSAFCTIDDKFVPLYRILWISALPHFCGSPECEREGDYEVRLECGESVWANREERDATLAALEEWSGEEPEEDLGE
ncbi:MAG: hypothetical protein HUU20_13280 [Pirellulales bacterium]|nr:hypothetical protein [Pirellulales bacterium]